jgi:acetoacetyl-CoA synthetase
MAEKLWQPSPEKIRETNMFRFITYVNERYGLEIAGYSPLYDWSVNRMEDFWGAVWDFTGIIASSPYERIVDDPAKMPGAKWFEGRGLILPRICSGIVTTMPAIVSRGENREPVTITYEELYSQVAMVAAGVKGTGGSPR